jgi:hypothetical protein
MSLLFDISPTDDPRRAKGKSRRFVTKAVVDEPVFTHRPRASSTQVPKALGTIDHTYKCLDERCQAECHDIWSEDRGRWYIECCFCGTGQWVDAVKQEDEPVVVEEDVFRLPQGVRDTFVGMTLDEVAEAGRIDYIRWAADKCGLEAVREAAKSWLASKQTGG